MAASIHAREKIGPVSQLVENMSAVLSARLETIG